MNESCFSLDQVAFMLSYYKTLRGRYYVRFQTSAVM